MSDIDPITGLPKELGVWEELVKEEQRIRIRIVNRKFGKLGIPCWDDIGCGFRICCNGACYRSTAHHYWTDS